MASETRFVLLFQEKESPYDTRAKFIEQDVAMCGEDKFLKAMQIAKEQYEKNGLSKWDSPYTDIESLTLDQLSSKINYI